MFILVPKMEKSQMARFLGEYHPFFMVTVIQLSKIQ
jgi:hypothetical protein